MVQDQGINLYSASEVAILMGVSRETLGIYAKRVCLHDRRISRVRYYTEEEIKQLLSASKRG